MNRVTIDESLRAQLDSFGSRLEFCDQAGHTLGYFIPASEERSLAYAWARGEFTDEEVERARREPGGLSLTELLADLRHG